MYHYDLPQPFQEFGGLLNKSFVDWFSNYSNVLFKVFGDDVKNWITFNEGYVTCLIGYGIGFIAPGINGQGVAEYKCAHNIIKAHAAAWHIYDEHYRSKQKGKLN